MLEHPDYLLYTRTWNNHCVCPSYHTAYLRYIILVAIMPKSPQSFATLPYDGFPTPHSLLDLAPLSDSEPDDQNQVIRDEDFNPNELLPKRPIDDLSPSVSANASPIKKKARSAALENPAMIVCTFTVDYNGDVLEVPRSSTITRNEAGDYTCSHCSRETAHA